MNGGFSFEFWRLFHNLTKHGFSEEEQERCQQMVGWTSENIVQLRQVCEWEELDILQAIHQFASDHQDLPSPEMVKDLIQQQTNKSEGALQAIQEYQDDDNHKTFSVGEMGQLLEDLTTAFEIRRLSAVMDRMTTIMTAGLEEKKTGRLVKGPKEAVNYFMGRLEQGILVNRVGTNRPIIVQNEGKELLEYYQSMKKMGYTETGVPGFRIYPADFVGILGYTGGGKSTLARFVAYNLCKQGKNVLHISLENDQEVERNKYQLMHAHDPEFFGDQFADLRYEQYKNLALSEEEEQLLAYVGEVFEKNIPGTLIIRQPTSRSWAAVKAIIELTDARTPIDVVLLDYLQLLDPSGRNADDHRVKMSEMVKDVRQFCLTYRPEKKLSIITPVQSNEDGLAKAEQQDGIWRLSAVSMDKELSRSMTFLLGTFDTGNTFGNMREMVLSCVKDRDAIGMKPMTYHLTGCGWLRNFEPFYSSGEKKEKVVQKEAEETRRFNDMVDDI